MQKNIKIKMIKIKVFLCVICLAISFPCNAFCENFKQNDERIEKKDNDIEFLPGEEVKTKSGRKMRVWSSKGTFRLEEGEKNNNGVDINSVIIDKRKDKKRK